MDSRSESNRPASVAAPREYFRKPAERESGSHFHTGKVPTASEYKSIPHGVAGCASFFLAPTLASEEVEAEEEAYNDEEEESPVGLFCLQVRE